MKADAIIPAAADYQNEPGIRKKVLYIPGFRSGLDPQKQAREELHRLYPQCEIRSMAWDKNCGLDILLSENKSTTQLCCSVQSAWNEFEKYSRKLLKGVPILKELLIREQWRIACQKAQIVAKELAKLIEKMPKSERENLILVGHSLGSRIVVKTLELLSRRQMKINQATLLGAAIDSDDSSIEAACQATINPIESTINNLDWALGFYRLESSSTALGQTGYKGKDVNLKEYRLSPNIKHRSAFYLKRLGMIRNGNNKTLPYKIKKLLSDIANHEFSIQDARKRFCQTAGNRILNLANELGNNLSANQQTILWGSIGTVLGCVARQVIIRSVPVVGAGLFIAKMLPVIGGAWGGVQGHAMDCEKICVIIEEELEQTRQVFAIV